MPLVIANGAGFLGDSLAAPRRLVEAARVDFLTLEYLAELTMSILARQRATNPEQGYAGDFALVLESLLPALAAQSQLHVVTNAGGVNPAACVVMAARRLVASGLGETRLGLVTGDDLLARGLDALRAAGCELRHFDTGESLFAAAPGQVMSANAYLGAAPIAEALAQDARIVITGRVADASLTVGTAMHAFGGNWQDWPTLAGFSVAGHLIECGAQVTGGYATDWATYRLADVGYPLAEVEADGSAIITKPPGSGGAVTRRTVCEQLTYEIGDPRAYLTPDVSVDFTSVVVQEIAPDRVRVSGAQGSAAPADYKVSLSYADGFMAAGELLVYGDDAVTKAEACADILFARMEAAGVTFARRQRELLGTGSAAGGPPNRNAREIMLRVAVHDADRANVERFTREFAPLITSGPAGLAGYAAGRPAVRPVYAYWPTLVPKELIAPHVEVRTAAQWAKA